MINTAIHPPTPPLRRGLLWPLDVGLLALAAVRWLMTVVMIAINWPELQSHIGFYFHHGGDQDYYIEYANVLLGGQFSQWFAVNLGQPAIMAVGLWLFNGQIFDDVLTYLVVINGWVFALLGIVLVGRLAFMFTGRVAVAWLAAGLWTFMPYLLYVAFFPHPQHIWLQAPYVPASAWLNGLPDGPATFFALLCLYFLLRAMTEKPRASLYGLLSGLALGVSLLFKAHLLSMLVLVAGFVGLWWLAEGRKLLTSQAVQVGGWVWRGVVLGYLPQVIYNYLARTWDTMLPWLPGYLYYGVLNSQTNAIDAELSPVSLEALASNLFAVLNRGNGVLWLLALIGLVAGGVAFWWVARQRGWLMAVLLFGAIPGTVGVNLVSAYFMEDPIRFSLPGFPMVLIVVSFLAVGASDWLWQRLRAARPTPQAHDTH